MLHKRTKVKSRKHITPIDKKSIISDIDAQMRMKMIGFIREFGLTEDNGSFQRVYTEVDLDEYSDEQICLLYGEIRYEIVNSIRNSKSNPRPASYWVALHLANSVVNDKAISTLLEAK